MSYLSVAVMSGALGLLTINPSLGQRAGEGSDKGARKEACRSEARLIYSGSGADREQKKLWRKSAIKDCMQRSAGGGSPGTASSEGSNKEARREACRTQAKVAYSWLRRSRASAAKSSPEIGTLKAACRTDAQLANP